MWIGQDCTGEELVTEKFYARFKTPEIVEGFKVSMEIAEVFIKVPSAAPVAPTAPRRTPAALKPTEAATRLLLNPPHPPPRRLEC